MINLYLFPEFDIGSSPNSGNLTVQISPFPEKRAEKNGWITNKVDKLVRYGSAS